MSKVPKSNSPLSKVGNNDVALLRRALAREKKARLAAERLLEDKSKELYDASLHLKEANGRLESLLHKKGAHLENAFVNIIDSYVVMDMGTKVIDMNASAKEFLGYDHTKEDLVLSDLVHKDYIKYTAESFQTLLQIGVLKNYNARIITKNLGERYVNINASLIYNEIGTPVAAQGVIRDVTKEYEIRQLLNDQKKQQDIIVENSPLGIVLIVNQKIVKANKTFIELLGYTEHELKKLSLDDVSTIEDVSLYQDLIQENERGESDKFALVRKFQKKNGELIYGKTSVSTVRNEVGEIDYKVALIEDITSDKLSEEKLRASEERLTTLISNLQTGILLEDENREIVLANQKFCDLFGISQSPEELKGIDCAHELEQSKYLFVNPEHLIRRVNYILDRKEVVISDELELVDGRTLERDYIPLFVDDVYKGHLWSYNDITFRKNYRRNLEIQKEKYSSIINNMNLGLVEINSEKQILMVNNRYTEMIGIPQEKLIGRNVLEIMNLSDEGRSKIAAQFESRRRGQSDSYEIEVTLHKNETKHWLISAAPTYDDSGKVIGSVGVHLDITAQKQLELQKQNLVNELEASNKGLQEYAHIVSHDLKSPLRSVSALATWLYEDYRDKIDENGKYNLQMILEKIEGMDKLIGGILKYSTVNSDTLDNTSVDVNEVIKEIEEIIYIPEHVRLEIVNELPIIQADKTKIHQLFQNFLSNAVVHIDKKEGVVKIACEDAKTHWQFSIKDNGIGIPKEYHEKIFKIFQSIGSNERSTGIGLSIVKKIIDRYEGKVWLESEIGVGTTFFFTLKKQLKNN